MCIPEAASTMFSAVSVFLSLLFRFFGFQKFTFIETTSLNVSACAMATCLLAGGCFSRSQALHEKCLKASTLSSLTCACRKRFAICCTDGCPSVRWIRSMPFLICTGTSCQVLHSFRPRLVSTHIGFVSPHLVVLTNIVCSGWLCLNRLKKLRKLRS